jgi:hypothetical protein
LLLLLHTTVDFTANKEPVTLSIARLTCPNAPTPSKLPRIHSLLPPITEATNLFHPGDLLLHKPIPFFTNLFLLFFPRKNSRTDYHQILSSGFLAPPTNQPSQFFSSLSPPFNTLTHTIKNSDPTNLRSSKAQRVVAELQFPNGEYNQIPGHFSLTQRLRSKQARWGENKHRTTKDSSEETEVFAVSLLAFASSLFGGGPR